MNNIIYIANWKMNISIKESEYFFKKFLSIYNKLPNKEIVFCPSFTTLVNVVRKYDNIDRTSFGAQNVSHILEGAHTGEVSASMLKGIPVEYCIVGHSERRNEYDETDNQINSKIKLLIANKIVPILCVGETLQDRENSQGANFIENQLSACLNNVKLDKIIIAYEPIWAIGTGRNATSSDISTMNKVIVDKMIALGYDLNQFYILYGGSVNINNVLYLKSSKHLNGFLIGGSSLDPLDFWNIINK